MKPSRHGEPASKRPFREHHAGNALRGKGKGTALSLFKQQAVK